MRGFDTVSFIFGLEVTWSLIQQRQQEEEEKKAMLELECMQEMVENASEESMQDGVEVAASDKKPSCKNPTGEEDYYVNKSGTPTTEATHFSDSENDESIVNTEAGESEQSFTEDQKEEESMANIENDETNQSVIVEEKKDEDDSNMIDSTSPAKEESGEKKRASPSNVWACSQCTFENKSSSRKCQMCGNKKTPKKRKH